MLSVFAFTLAIACCICCCSCSIQFSCKFNIYQTKHYCPLATTWMKLIRFYQGTCVYNVWYLNEFIAIYKYFMYSIKSIRKIKKWSSMIFYYLLSFLCAYEISCFAFTIAQISQLIARWYRIEILTTDCFNSLWMVINLTII